MQQSSLAVPAFVRGLSYELGETRLDIGTVPELAADPALLERYREQGQRFFSSTEEPASRLAFRCLRRTLETAQIAPSQIDAIVYASGSFFAWAPHTEPIEDEMLALGLTDVPVVGVHLTGCGKLGHALRIAVGYLAQAGCNNVLVVTADAWPARYGPGRLQPDLGVMSDGGAACLVTRDATNAQFAIRDLVQTGKFSLHEDMEGTLRFRLMVSGIQRSFRELYRRTGLTPADVKLLFTNNYLRDVQEGFAYCAGMPLDKTYTTNISKVGYTFSADVLINLVDALAERRLAEKDLVMVLSTGRLAWTCLALEVLPAAVSA